MGDKVFPDLIHDLEHAKKYIFLEFFIINHGKVWDDILEVLVKKVAEGVEVRVIYDDVGSVLCKQELLERAGEDGNKVYLF